MLKEIIKVGFLLAAGMMVYDINKAGAFVNSDVYKFLKENGVVEYVKIFMTQLKKIISQAIEVFEDDAVIYGDYMCLDMYSYIDLFYNMFLICKNSVLSVFENSSDSFNKNFPTAVDDVSMLVSGALTSTKEGLVMISSHLQNFTLSAVNYANEVLRT